MTAPNAPPKRRRWLSFSLRALLLATAVFAVWLGIKVAAARRQHAAVEAILAAGGTVFYDYQHLGYTVVDRNAEFPAPQWLRNLAGDDFFVTTTHVELEGERCSDQFVEALVASLPDLVSLKIEDSEISGDVLRPIGRLKKLEEISIVGLNANLDDLHALNSLKSISWISIFREPESKLVQAILRTKTQVDFVDVPLCEAVEGWAESHHVRISFDAGEDDAGRRTNVTLTTKDWVSDVLSSLLKASNLNYVIRVNQEGVTLASPAVAREKWPAYEMLKTMFPNAETDADW